MTSKGRVSPFGYFRIKGYKSPPRNFSQTSYVLHRLCKPRHPPCTLTVSCAETQTPLFVLCDFSKRYVLANVSLVCNFINNQTCPKTRLPVVDLPILRIRVSTNSCCQKKYPSSGRSRLHAIRPKASTRSVFGEISLSSTRKWKYTRAT